MTDVRIRRLVPDEADEAAALRRYALLDRPFAFLSSPEDDPVSTAGTMRTLLERGEADVVFGAFDPGLCGMAGLARDRHLKSAHKAHLWGVFVHPRARRQGLARRLIAAALDHARSLEGVDLVHLGVSEATPEARALYEGMGFRVWGVEPDCVRIGSRSAREFHMLLPLRPARAID